MNNIDNIQFKFTQTTNKNIEKGKCILAFPGKLKCDYKDKNEKELIVNKKMMAITQKRYGKTLFYPLSKSTFINILSKNELIKIIDESSTFIDDYINIIFIDKNNIKTLIKFDKKVMLAGNIKFNDNLENLKKIADIIDISGGLETSGLKDISKIDIFLNNIENLKNES